MCVDQGDNVQNHLRKQLTDVANGWRDLEERIKLCEQVQAAVDIASINQLRYAGRRLVAAMTNLANGDEENCQKNLLMAFSYYHNAQHDLTDALVGFYNIQFRYLAKRYGQSVVESQATYQNVSRVMNNAMDLIKQSRRHMDQPRHDIYNKLVDHSDALIAAYSDFVSMDSELDRRKRADIRLTVAAIAVGVIGAIFGGARLYLDLFGS